MTKPLIYIVGTGGTIASRYIPSQGAHVAAASAAELAASVQGLADIAEVRAIEHSNVTSDIIDTPTIVDLGKVVRRLLAEEKTVGVVITHGTATLEETAYFLDLTSRSDKPVVVTGAMRNSVDPDADGPRNILYSVIVAAHPASRGRGVLVCFNGQVHSARDAVKVHANRVNAYASRDGGPVGAITKDGLIYFSRPERAVHIDVDHMKENVQLIVVSQGVNDLLMRACLQARVDGVVIEGIGAGNVNLPYYHAICDALKAGIPVVVGVRMLEGTPYFAKGHEASFRTMIERGAISAGYLSGVKARILLMVALAQTSDSGELRKIFARAGGASLP
jgi:L-asparaginase